MKRMKAGIMFCLAAALNVGCVSLGNGGAGALTEEEKQQVEAAFDEAKAAVTQVRDEVSEELKNINWAKALLEEKPDGREQKLLWQSTDEKEMGEIADRNAFAESLALEEWKPTEQDVEVLQEELIYMVQQKKSVGVLDGSKEDYRTIGSIVVYRDSNLVLVRADILENTAGKMMEKLLNEEDGGWFGAVYEVPEERLAVLREIV